MGELPSPVGRGSNKRGNMQRSFGGGAFEPVDERRDKELTLGPTMLVALACGLLVLCGLCFVFGYAVGHRSGGEGAAATGESSRGGAALGVGAVTGPDTSWTASSGGAGIAWGNVYPAAPWDTTRLMSDCTSAGLLMSGKGSCPWRPADSTVRLPALTRRSTIF